MNGDVEQDNVDTQTITLVGILGAAIAFLLILGVQVLYYRLNKADTYRKQVEPGSMRLKSMLSEQQMRLEAYKWADRDKALVSIPIERAMELQVRDLQRQAPGK